MKICLNCRRCYDDDDLSCDTCKVSLPERTVAVPHRIEVHRLEKRLGRGGMGMVFEARDLLLSRFVAIKVLQMESLLESFLDRNPQAADDPAEVEQYRQQMRHRFKREAKAAASINDGNVVKIYSYGVLAPLGEGHEDTAYIVMELVEGLPLQHYLRRRRGAALSELVSIARQVASGIKAAHRKQVIHRDLKPANIMVTLDEEDGEVQAKVLDFGIAKLMEQTSAELTKTGAMIGTVEYMSPEQCAGADVDARSDLYSLGVIMYEMLAGRRPFEAPNLTALALKHINDDPPPLHEARPDLPPALSELVMRSLRKNPEERPRNATEVAKQLWQIELSLLSNTANPMPAPAPAPPPFAGDENPTLLDHPKPITQTAEPAHPEPVKEGTSETTREAGLLAPPEGLSPPADEATAGEWFDFDIGEMDGQSVPAAVPEPIPPEPPPALTEPPPADAEHQNAVAPFDEISVTPASSQQPLDDGESARVAAAVIELSHLDTDESFQQICAAFDDEAKEVRNAAARALYTVRPDVAESFTRALREAHPERRRRIGAAIFTSGLADEELNNLTNPTREVAYQAFSLLFLMAKAGELQPLLSAIQRHPSDEVRLAVVKLLALSGQKEVLPAFRRLAVRGSLPTEVRSAVMEAIYQISSSQPTPA
ncbi:MAG: protein kinase [Acidobacteria bacterium]|nr:protein kinase [Acidobacteriota bacterium]